jgi:DTW domain-containing protein YfiP
MSRKKSTAVADEKPVDKPALELTARERTVFEKYREIHTNTATAATRMKLVTDADKRSWSRTMARSLLASCCWRTPSGQPISIFPTA